MKTKLRTIAAAAALLLASTAAWADEITYPYDFQLGTGISSSEQAYVKGRLNASGTLYIWDTGRANTVSGTSEMKGADDATNANAIWYDFSNDKNYSSYIKNVIFLAAGQQPNTDATGTEAAPTSTSIKYTGVTRIGNYSFAACSNLESVTFVSGLKEIGAYAFNGCTKLTAADLSVCTTLTTINNAAFSGCTALETVSLPGSLENTGETATSFAICMSAFYQCTALTTLTFAANTNAMSIGESAFDGCSALTEIDLSPCTNLKNIGKYAFRNCSSVRYTKLPSSIVNGASEGNATELAVGSGAFTGCTGTLDLSDAVLTDATKIPFISTSFNRGNVQNILGGSKFDASMFVYLPKNYTGDKPKNGTYDNQHNIAYWDGSAWICPEFRTSSTKVIYLKYPATVQKYANVRNIYSGTADTYTICLPYAPPAVTGLTYYELSSVSGTTLTFTEAASPEAYKPYLITTDATTYTTNTPFNISASGTSVSFPATPEGEMAVTADGYKMVGTLTNISAAETVGKYILQDDNKWQKTDSEISGVKIEALRAYIVAPTGSAPSLSTSFDGDNGTTAIQNVRTVATDGTEQWYDLNGRRIAQPTQRGIYIINGKKVVR